MKIDYVLTYVRQTDRWISDFRKTVPENVGYLKKWGFRYNSNNLLKYHFRGIEKNLPWVDNVLLVVQDYDQIPDFINTDKVRIVLHNEFIPQEFLPTFNSTTIELFLWNINGLADNFIYANDDMFILKNLEYSRLFPDGIPTNDFIIKSAVRDKDYYQMCKTNSMLAADPRSQSNVVCEPLHVPHTFNKKMYYDMFRLHDWDILNSITKIRNGINICQYYFILKQQYTFHKKMPNLDIAHIDCRYAVERNEKLNDMCNHETLCLNNSSDEIDAVFVPHFEKIFPNKSVFEL